MAYPLADVSPTAAIQAVYIGYYTRAADSQGFEFWLDLYQEHLNGAEDGDPGLSLVDIANDFATQAETKAAYPFFESPNLVDAESFIIEVYANLFDREPDTAGLNFWAGVLAANPANAGEIVLQIIEGATNELGDIDTLQNKIDAATYWSQQTASNSVGTASNPIAETNDDGQLVILDPEAFQSAKDSVQGEGDDGFGQDDLDASRDATDAFIASLTATPPPVDETVILTDGIDVETTGEGNDTFEADQDTLDNADDLDGAGGDDILEVAVQSGEGSLFAAPSLANIETVQVNGPSLEPGQDITIDLSNATGYETLRSFQTTVDAPSGQFMSLSMGPTPVVSFLDIQDVNNTDLEIIDTDVDHLFTYDSNAYESLFGAAAPSAPNGGEDTAELLLQEVDGSNITLANENAVPAPGGDFRSHVDTVSIDSQARSQVNTTSFNFVQSLTVGPVFTTLEVTGNADLEIEEFLEGPTSTGPNPEDVIGGVNTVEAATLDGDLALDLIGQGVREPLDSVQDVQTLFNVTGGDNPFNPDGNLNVFGAMGDNRIDVSGDTNGTFLFQGGDDLLRVGNSSDTDYVPQDVFGNLLVGTGAGDDEVILNITGEQTVNLGDDDDTLTINGNVDDLSTIPFNDGRSVIEAGAGHDEVTLNGQSVFGIAVEDLDNDYLIDLGEGDDTLVANQGGDHDVTGGDGEDDITINGNGNQVIDSGNDDDDVAINGDGFHNILLGDGNDDLSIIGSRLTDNNIDFTFPENQTNIDAGAGDDTVFIDGDHYLNVLLGDGSDSIELNADELTVDDRIDGGNDDGSDVDDTLILNNNNGNVQDGSVGRSETSSVTGIEVFDLRDTNISLALSSDNFDTSVDNNILVKTTEADNLQIPLLSGGVGPQLSQGMTRAEFEAVAQFHFGSDALTVNEEVDLLIDFLLANGVSEVGVFDGNGSGDGQTFTGAAGYTGGTGTGSSVVDTVDFQGIVGGKMTIDITDIPMNVASGRSFELQGGSIKDVVIADDASISSRLVLDFDASGDDLQSREDTLQVIDGADITAADLRNTQGLEIIELMSAENAAQTWKIELNDNVINQTTSNAPLKIVVDPNVPAGSEVYIDLDPSIWSNTATKNVIIETVANAQIFVDLNDGNGPQLVTEPEFGDDLIDGLGALGSIVVTPRLLFTQNSDSLVGRDDVNDTFTFDSISKLQQSDSADGKTGQDRLFADNVTVSNLGESLYEQLNQPELISIEEIVFDTGMNVQMTRLDDGKGGGNQPLEGMLNTVRTGAGNDTLLQMEAIGGSDLEGYFLNGGDDVFTTDGSDEDYYVDGGLGDDEVTVADDDDLFGTDIELINLEGNADATVRTLQGTDGSTMTITGRPDTDNNNTVTLSSSIMAAAGGLATVVLEDIEDVIDNGGDNNIVLDNDRGGPDGDATVTLNAGDDNLTVTNVDDLVVTAAAGEKTVTVGGGVDTPTVDNLGIVTYPFIGASNVNNFTYTGGTGNNAGVDNINAVADDDITINAGDLDDTIVALSTQGGVVNVNGGAGADTIFAAAFGGTVVVDGGAGADDITVDTALGETSTITTGLGIDNVVLSTEIAGAGGSDTIVFGDIVYNTQQQVAGGTTQNFVQNGIDDPAHAANTAENGVDTISFFNMEGGGPGAEDVLDVSAFITDDEGPLNADDFQYGDWTGGITNVDAYDFDPVLFGIVVDEYSEVAVIAVNDGFELDGSHIVASDITPGVPVFGGGSDNQNAPGIEVDDNGSRVVVAARDTDGDNAFDTADVYFVQDVDQDAGQAWAVDKVATINFATEIGAITSIDADNFNF